MLKFKINYLELMQIMLRAPVKIFSVIIPIVSIFFLFLSKSKINCFFFQTMFFKFNKTNCENTAQA